MVRVLAAQRRAEDLDANDAGGLLSPGSDCVARRRVIML